MFQQVLAIFLVLALLGAALWFLRSRGLAHYRGPARRKSARHLEAIARLPLTPQHSVHLIRVSDHAVLLALSPTGCTLVETPAVESRRRSWKSRSRLRGSRAMMRGSWLRGYRRCCVYGGSGHGARGAPLPRRRYSA